MLVVASKKVYIRDNIHFLLAYSMLARGAEKQSRGKGRETAEKEDESHVAMMFSQAKAHAAAAL